MSVTQKPNGYVVHQSLADSIDLANFNALVVGGTNGLGKALAESLLKRNASVTIVGRNEPKDLTEHEAFKVKFVEADLISLKTAKETAQKLSKDTYDALVFTAGIFPSSLTRTVEGIESDLAVSFLSRMVMINEFISNGLGSKRLASGLKPKIFIFGYPGAKVDAKLDDFNWDKTYNYMDAHFNTVAGNEAFQHYLADKYRKSLTIIGVNPGLIKTGIRQDLVKNPFANWMVEGMIGLVSPSAEQFAEKMLINLVLDRNIDDDHFSGASFDQKGNQILPNPLLTDDVQNKILSLSNDLVKNTGLTLGVLNS